MLEPETGGAAAPNNAREQQVVAYNELLRQAGRGGAAADPVLDRLNRARTLLRRAGDPVRRWRDLVAKLASTPAWRWLAGAQRIVRLHEATREYLVEHGWPLVPSAAQEEGHVGSSVGEVVRPVAAQALHTIHTAIDTPGERRVLASIALKILQFARHPARTGIYAAAFGFAAQNLTPERIVAVLGFVADALLYLRQ